MKELIEIQRDLKAPKNQYNSFGKYNYRNAEDILEALKPLLAEKNCLLTLNDNIQLIGNRFYIECIATITNQENISVSVKAFAREEETKKGMDGSQVTGASSSYARKYALNGLFLIDDSNDSDISNTEGKPTLESLSQEIAQAGSIEELEKIYKENPQFHNNNQFIKLLKEKKEFIQ